MIDFSKFEPDEQEKKDGMITKSAVPCRICGAPANRYCDRFECQKNKNHVGDLNVGIFSDLSH